MRALCWHGHGDVRVDTVPDPAIQHHSRCNHRDFRVCHFADQLHLLDGYQPTMKSGDILGHENMGTVVELGSEVSNLRVGDRVVVPFTIGTLANAGFAPRDCIRPASEPTRTPPWPSKPWDTRQRDCSASVTCSAATVAVRLNICVCPWPMSAPSRFPITSPTSRRFSYRYLPHQVHGRQQCADRGRRYRGHLGVRAGRTNLQFALRC